MLNYARNSPLEWYNKNEIKNCGSGRFQLKFPNEFPVWETGEAKASEEILELGDYPKVGLRTRGRQGSGCYPHNIHQIQALYVKETPLLKPERWYPYKLRRFSPHHCVMTELGGYKLWPVASLS
jgi:hypothetical protein